VVRTVTIRMVRWARVFSGADVAVMGRIEVTTLHPRGSGNPELPFAPKVTLPTSEESLRVVCKDGDPLCNIPMKMVPESPSSREKLRRPRRSAVNSRLPNHMV
jgi:hypothetical protein